MCSSSFGDSRNVVKAWHKLELKKATRGGHRAGTGSCCAGESAGRQCTAGRRCASPARCWANNCQRRCRYWLCGNRMSDRSDASRGPHFGWAGPDGYGCDRRTRDTELRSSRPKWCSSATKAARLSIIMVATMARIRCQN
jgi:hypothetical protein